MKSFDTFIIIATTYTSVTLSVIGTGLIVKPLSTGVACGSKKATSEIFFEILINLENFIREQIRPKIDMTNYLFRKCSKNNVIDRKKYASIGKVVKHFI